MNNFRLLYSLMLFFVAKSSWAQNVKTYKDAVNHFEITIPINWNVTQSNPRLKFIAIHSEMDPSASVPENINLNFINAPDGNLDAAYNMSIESNSTLNGFIGIGQKGKAADNRYKWYTNSHKDIPSGLTMQSVVFVYYVHQNAILLTCNASPGSFEKYKPIFFKIANSLKLN